MHDQREKKVQSQTKFFNNAETQNKARDVFQFLEKTALSGSAM